MGLNSKIEIKKECREIHGLEGAFEKAIRFLKVQYKFYDSIDPEKTIEIKIEQILNNPSGE